MSFDAGSITGKLGLDTHDLLVAESVMELFPHIVTEFMANPILGLAETAKEAFSFVRESISETIDEANQMGIDSSKLGVDPAWLSQWSGVAKSVSIDQGTLTNGMWMLTRQVGDALQGSKEAQKGFSELGISMQWLKDHAGDTSAIFDEVEKKLSAMPDASKRAAAAQDVLGRGAKELGPIFNLSAGDIQHMMEVQKKLGDVTDESEVQSAKAAKRLENEWREAMEGIRKSIGQGFMDELANRAPEVENDLIGTAGSARDMGKALGDVAVDSIPVLIAALHGLDSLLKEIDGAMQALPNMGANDWRHPSIGRIGPQEQTMHSGPIAHNPNRQKEEDEIFKEFNFHVPHDWSDDQVSKLNQSALDKESGAYNPFPGSQANAPAPSSSPSSSPAPQGPVDSWPEEQRLINRISSGQEHGDQLKADEDRYHQLSQGDFNRAMQTTHPAATAQAPSLGPPAPTADGHSAQINVNISAMHVHLDKTASRDGEIGKAILDQVAKAQQQAMNRSDQSRTVHSSIAGSLGGDG